MSIRPWTKWFLIAFAASTLAGCVSAPKIDWPARVGNYTYDQAVRDFGPPDKSAKLSDGSVVADWLERPAETIVTPEPYFAPPGCYFGPFSPTYTETRVPPLFLRLTFGPDGRLAQFKESAR